MVKLGWSGQLISFGIGMNCDAYSSFICYFDNSSYKPLVQYDLFTKETLPKFIRIL